MQVKLQELQTKLSEEESEKGEILKKYSTAEKQLQEQQHKMNEVLKPTDSMCDQLDHKYVN